MGLDQFVGSALAGPLSCVASHHAAGRPPAPIREEVEERQVALLSQGRAAELSAGLATSRPPPDHLHQAFTARSPLITN